MKKDNIILILLIILSIQILIRTFLYIIFDKKFFNYGKSIFGKNYDKNMDSIFLIFSVSRLFLVSLILYLKGLRNDILTYILIYLAFSSFVRFYYNYEKNNYEKMKDIYFIDKVRDIETFILFLLSLYIIYYVFLR
jgi:hypothetical protein